MVQAKISNRRVTHISPVPFIAWWQRRRVDQRFESNQDTQLFRGIFDTFEAAAASAPATRPLGYDNPESAALYLRRLRVDEHDYPALFWIASGINDGMRRVVDIGGSVGIKYFAFSRFTAFPADLRWLVIDVPAVAARGREFAAQKGVSEALAFSDSPASADGADLLYASGSLQYLPQTLSDMLAALPLKPRRIVVNTTAIHPTRSFFTLNSVGTAYCPYRVQDREAFVASVLMQGYRLRDEWQNQNKYMRIPFEPEASLDCYSGFCFDRVERSAAS